MAAESPEALIWYELTERPDARRVESALALLSADERARHDRFVFPEDKRDYALAHGLARRLVAGRQGIEPSHVTFTADDRGKPFLGRVDPAVALQFNLSHTRGLVGCAVVEGADIGLDVERIDRDVDDGEIARRFFSPSERAALEQCDVDTRARRFIEIWTLKEAYLKATGAGLSDALDRFSFTFSADDRIELDGPVVSGLWTFALFAPTRLTRMAVAIHSTRVADWRIVARADDRGEELGAISRGCSR